MDKEGFAIVSMFHRLEYLLWGEVRIHANHRDLAYIFEPEACASSMPKTAAERLESWKVVLARYDYTIVHICGERDYCWDDPLSRWVNVPGVAVRAVAVFASSARDETMPSKDAFCEVQQQARAGLSAIVSGASSSTTPVGRATKNKEDLFRVGLDGRYVLWILEQAKNMQTCFVICAHMKDDGHRGSWRLCSGLWTCPNFERGHSCLMTSPIHLGSRTSQEADDNTRQFFVSEWSKAAIKHDPRTPCYT